MPYFKRFLISAWAVLFLITGAGPGWCDTKYETNATTNEKTRPKTRLKVGLALGGGGARGAAHVGVLKILEEQGVPIDYIVGTNVGAVVGGLYAAGVSLPSIEEMFTKRSLMNAYLTVPLKVRILVIPLFSASRLFGRRSLDGLYRGNKFRKFLNRYVPESERDVQDLKIPFGAVAFDLIDGKAKVLTSGNLGSVLQASSAIPVLRKPVKLKTASQEGLFVDGGVSVNIPVEQVKKMGADIVIAVNLDDSSNASKEEEFYKVGSVSHRVINLHLMAIDKAQLEKADVIINPNVDHIGLISGKSKDAKDAINAGEQAALEMIDQINTLIK